MSRNTARGVVFIHSAPAALCPHLEWSLAQILPQPQLNWEPQPAAAQAWRAELPWHGVPGMGARMVTALAGWERLRFEVTEEPNSGLGGSRWSYLPEFGVHHGAMNAHGELQLGEELLRELIAKTQSNPGALALEIQQALGLPWDQGLEPFRQAGQGAAVRWLHRVG